MRDIYLFLLEMLTAVIMAFGFVAMIIMALYNIMAGD